LPNIGSATGTPGGTGGGVTGSGGSGGGAPSAGAYTTGSGSPSGTGSTAGMSSGGTGGYPAGATTTTVATPGAIAGGAPTGNMVSTGNSSGAVSGTPAQPPQLPEGYVPGRPYEAPATPPRKPDPEPLANAETVPAMPLRPGEWHPSQPAPPRHREEPDDKRRGPDNEWDKREKKHEMSAAEKRGRDWALRNAARGSVAVTRPIRMECYPDRLVIMPEPGVPPVAPVPFDGRTSQSLDRLISVLWDHMEGWGIAGKGMYWRPVLKIRVAPGAEQRFTELSSLLEGSGLTVQREP
jgi:hypothetical protein